MKILFDPIVKKVSGRLGNLVFIPNNKIVNIAGEQSVSGIVRAISNKPINKIRIDNINRAFSIASNEWTKITDYEDRSSWISRAAFLSREHKVTRSARALFIGFFVYKYAAQLSSFVRPTTLSTGTGKTFIRRMNRTWS